MILYLLNIIFNRYFTSKVIGCFVNGKEDGDFNYYLNDYYLFTKKYNNVKKIKGSWCVVS